VRNITDKNLATIVLMEKCLCYGNQNKCPHTLQIIDLVNAPKIFPPPKAEPLLLASILLAGPPQAGHFKRNPSNPTWTLEELTSALPQ
jgi:hypothetical protein